jgi:hypothetical protein
VPNGSQSAPAYRGFSLFDCVNLAIPKQIMAEIWPESALIRTLGLIRSDKLVITERKNIIEQHKEAGNVKNCIGR